MAEQVQRTILLTGSTGQIGGELRETLTPLGRVHAIGRAELDLCDLDAVRSTVRRLHPNVIVNAAAYTQVDRAESEPDLARRINADAPRVLAETAAELGAIMVHYSTDYVFDGAGSRPYLETDPAAPLNVYGETKLAGDAAILGTGCDAYIFRISWVYGLRGQNFLRTIRRLASERPELRIVADQHGSPTWARTIAEGTTVALGHVLGARERKTPHAQAGIYHMAAPDATTWCGFAEAIVAATECAGRPRPRVIPISTAEYPTPARRPRNSILDAGRLRTAFGVQLPPWREQLRRCLATETGAPALQ